MGLTNIVTAATVLLTGLLPASCHKVSAQKKKSAPVIAASATNNLMVARDLGDVTLTNHSETCFQLEPGKDCTLTPKILDSRNVQITLMVASKTNAGQIHAMSFAQVVTRPGKRFEIAVGDFNLTVCPTVAAE